MRVKLVRYTVDAEDLLIFTKQTRLEMSPEGMEEIENWPVERKMEELKYMANTIPSSWEFVDYVFLITGVSRAFTHQFVRTRTGSFAQQSMRVTDQNGFNFITGPSLKNEAEADYYACMNLIQQHYEAIIAQGGALEDARGVLPTNICTNIVAKFNLRTMSDLAKSRSGGRTQSEYRDVMNAMCDEVLSVHPWAGMFLYPQGRDYFKEMETLLEGLKKIEPKLAQDILKIIDKMRKS